MGLVSTISRNENDLHNTFAFLNFFSVSFSQQINQCLKSSDFPDFFKIWSKFNKTGHQYSKSIKKVDI